MFRRKRSNTYMKYNIPRCLLAAGMAAVLFSACRKDNISKNTPAVSKHRYKPEAGMKAVDVTNLEPNSMSWPDRVIGYDDADAEFRKAKLFYAIGLREIVKDPVIAQWICEQAKQAENNVIFLDDVFAAFPGTREVVEATADPLGTMTGWPLEQVTAKMQYDDYDIKPAIFLMNAAKADATYKPLVSPGDDLDVDDTTRGGDVVMAFHLNDQNESTAVNLWGILATDLFAPVLCIDGIATNLDGREDTEPTPTLPTGRTTEYFPISDYPHMRLTMKRFRINHRYDASGKSDLFIISQCVGIPDPNDDNSIGVSREFFRKDCLNPDTRAEDLIAKVHKRDIGKEMTTDRYFAKAHTPWPLDLWKGEYDHYMLSTPSGPRLMNRKFLVYNLYEHDDFSSPKNLIYAKFNNKTIVRMSGRMTKYNEWYLFNPDDNFLHYSINMPYPYIGWGHDDDHPKGGCYVEINNHCTY